MPTQGGHPATRPLSGAEGDLLRRAVGRSQRFVWTYVLIVIACVGSIPLLFLPFGFVSPGFRSWWYDGPVGLFGGVLALVGPIFLLFAAVQVYTTRTYRTQVQTVLSDGKVREVRGTVRKTSYRGKWVTVRSIMVGDDKLSLDDDGNLCDGQSTRTFRQVKDGSSVQLEYVLAHVIRDGLAVGWLLCVDGQALPSPQRITWESTADLPPPSPRLLAGDLAASAAQGRFVLTIERVGTVFEREAPGRRSLSLGGVIASGSVRRGETVRLRPGPGSQSSERSVKVERIFPGTGGRYVEAASAGQSVNLVVWGLGPDEVKSGDALVASP